MVGRDNPTPGNLLGKAYCGLMMMILWNQPSDEE
jgi:hypothetical protein